MIHPRSKDCIVKPKSIFPPLRTQSIFKKEHRSEPLIDEKTSHAAEAPKIERTFAPTSQQQVPPPKLRDSDWEAKKVAKLAQARQAIDHIDKKPIEKRSPPPVIPRPRPTFQSPYVEEYAKCGCTKDGGNPCRRCQLMLLSDRQVIDVRDENVCNADIFN